MTLGAIEWGLQDYQQGSIFSDIERFSFVLYPEGKAIPEEAFFFSARNLKDKKNYLALRTKLVCFLCVKQYA
ncbi:hypothetical protein LCGC14_1389650 [marine sediment metagenome]|uniref:Uncharacterized protein n=1 Tax=marine sediment metagenome TaxID=412755 RepID=A0A0F9KL50_9ZZZZ